MLKLSRRHFTAMAATIKEGRSVCRTSPDRLKEAHARRGMGGLVAKLNRAMLGTA